MEKLKFLRNKMKRTQQEVASYLGVSYQAYAGYETGRREPDNKTLSLLADYFDVSVDYLLGRNQGQNITNELIDTVNIEPDNNQIVARGRSGKKIEYDLPEEDYQALLILIDKYKKDKNK